jgi:pilus assembly protein FimV
MADIKISSQKSDMQPNAPQQSTMTPEMPPEKSPSRCGFPRPVLIRTLFPVAIGFTAGFTTPALALSLGPITTNGYIGTPLRIEIPVLTSNAEELDVSCIKIAGTPKSNVDDIPWITRGNLSIETTSAGKVLVIRTAAMNQPAFMLGLRAECGINLQRDYTILLDPPPSKETPAVAFTPAQPVVAPLPRTSLPTPAGVTSSGSWQIQPGDTARNIAARLAPRQRSLQRQLATDILTLNSNRLPEGTQSGQILPEGVEISLPSLPASQTPRPTPHPPATVTAARPLPNPDTASNPTRLVQTAPIRLHPAQRGHNIVVVTGGADLPLRLSTTLGEPGTPSQSDVTEPTEQQLIAELDEKTASQIELKERLRQLEALQRRLQEETASLELELQKYPSAQSTPAAISSPVAMPIRHPVAASSTPVPAGWNWLWIAVGLGGALLAAVGVMQTLRYLRRRSQEKLDGDTLPLPAPEGVSLGENGALGVPLSEADIWPDHDGIAPGINEQARTAKTANFGQFTASGLGPASVLHIVEHDVEEHDSAIELAEIMLSFGRVQGAAQTLADYIRNHPKQAIRPWLKLLEVYKTADMRIEFGALMQQLHHNFNVKPTDWESFNPTREMPDSLEQLPHIVEQLTQLWGTRECQGFLYKLLRDNRDGTRQGFPLSMIDEILLLLSVLEQELGPFRPSEHEEALARPAGLSSYNREEVPANAPAASADDTLRLDLPPTSTLTKSGSFPPLPQPEPTQSFLNLDFELDLDDQSQTQSFETENQPDAGKPGTEASKPT